MVFHGCAARSAARPRVLVIDDEEAIRSALGRALAAEGLVTDLAGTAADGLSRARAEVYDLVILDLLMPGTDGSAVPVGRAVARAPAEPPGAPRRIPGRASRTSSAGRASRTSAAKPRQPHLRCRPRQPHRRPALSRLSVRKPQPPPPPSPSHWPRRPARPNRNDVTS